MRLWHYRLLSRLDRQRLMSQHRECCALRGKGWGKKHATVDYVFKHDYMMLFDYHAEVMDEMERRGYHVDSIWRDPTWRGSALGYDASATKRTEMFEHYPEHDDAYLETCLRRLEEKGAKLI